MFMGDGGIWLYAWLIILVCAVGFAGFIYLIVWLIGKQGKSSPSSQVNPMDIVKERYARGEISRDEFEKMKKDLS
jgi:putative membrane protein